MSGVTLGTRYDIDPIPPLDEHTRYLDAGPVKIGVEFRQLNDDILAQNFGVDTEAASIVNADKPEDLEDQGFSIHVFDAGTGGEHLRFDMFDGDPHYHYIVPGQYNILIPYDPDAFGDMFEWAIECLRSRLPAMLRRAEAGDLAERVDQARVDAVIPEIAALVQRPVAT